MGLFTKMFGKDDSSSEKNLAFDLLPPCKTVDELLERYAAIGLEGQGNLGEVIGDNNWNVDMNTGTISFGPGLDFPIQVLGTVSFSSGTWLWAWANKESNISENLLQNALHLKAYGEANDIDLLKNYQFEFSKDEMHLLGIIAAGMCKASAYYIADYGQGAMLVTIKSDQIDKAGIDPHLRIISNFTDVIEMFEMNHKTAFRNYLLAKTYALSETENTIEGSKNGKTVKASFDEEQRLTNLEA